MQVNVHLHNMTAVPSQMIRQTTCSEALIFPETSVLHFCILFCTLASLVDPSCQKTRTVMVMNGMAVDIIITTKERTNQSSVGLVADCYLFFAKPQPCIRSNC